ncbi:MAG: hypothetical protein IJV86_03810 [Clostridia bacterium]|nr:hypothetical protein [Clostridia bacterium]
MFKKFLKYIVDYKHKLSKLQILYLFLGFVAKNVDFDDCIGSIEDTK